MKDLTLVYHFQASQNSSENFQPARYRVVFFFSGTGFLDHKLMQELAKSVPDANHAELTFLNLDDLKAFASRVSQELRASQVRLLSVQDYNIGMDGAKDVESFRQIFQKFGELLVEEVETKKKGFLGKLFS
jgi:hypothetical protein